MPRHRHIHGLKAMQGTRYFLMLSLLICMTGNVHAADSRSRYQSWQPPAGEAVQRSAGTTDDSPRLQQMIDELNVLIDDADKARAADRRFIEDLRSVVNQYDWPWRKSLLEEDFTDGTLNNKSIWRTISGDIQIKRGLGMYSVVSEQQPASDSRREYSDQDAAAMLLGAFLDQALKTESSGNTRQEKSPQSGKASISASRKISNAFAIDTTIDVRNRSGRLEIGVFQGSVTGSGYRLVFLPGPTASLEVQRIGRRGVSIIDVADKVAAAGDRVHQLQWTRDKKGNMSVILNGKTVLKVADRSYKDGFSGLVINNQAGEFAIQHLKLQGV